MKKLYLVLVALLVAGVANAQVSLTGMGNSVTFTTPPTAQSGTTGTATCSEVLLVNQKHTDCVLSGGYTETGAGQTYVLPFAYTQTPNVIQSSCPNSSATPASSTTTTVTLPFGASMSAESCNIVIVGI